MRRDFFATQRSDPQINCRDQGLNAVYSWFSNATFLGCVVRVPVTPRKKALGDAIRTYRKRANLTQERLAERSALNYKYLGEVERGEKTISVEALARIAQALKVRMAKLVEKL